jgi:hypothetical protein
MAALMMPSTTNLFVPPSCVDAVVVLSPAADPRVVLTEVTREFVLRFGLSPDFWELDVGKRRDGFPAPEAFAALALGEQGFYAYGGESGGIGLMRVTAGQHEAADSETNGLRDCWRLQLTSPDLSVDQDAARVRRSLASREALVRALSVRCPVVRAHISRTASVFAPAPPHAMPGDVLFIAQRAEIALAYVAPDVYWRAWDSSTDLGRGRVLLTRALDVADEIEYKRRTYPAAWAMARAARPGLTRYHHSAAGELGPGEQALLDGEESTLSQVGYNAQEQWIEFTAMVPDGAHMAAREIFMLHDLLVAKQLPSGEPLRRVRVTFPNRAIAEREARPLIDNGVVVLYFSDRGTWEVLEG